VKNLTNAKREILGGGEGMVEVEESDLQLNW